MIPRLIGLSIAGALLAGFSSAALSETADAPAPLAVSGHTSATTRIDFAISAPAAAPARSASLSAAAADGTRIEATANVTCSPTCNGSLTVPLGSQRLTAKLFAGADGTGRLIALGSTTQLITSQTKSIPLTFNTVVASVKLALANSNILADPGATTQLLIYALDSHGAVIVGPGNYLNASHQPITITISNSAPSNTTIAPFTFAKPVPSQGASNVATITYRGRAHFNFPTFRVATAGLPALPAAGVTLTYVPDPQNDLSLDDPIAPCIGQNVSVGGYYYGGPFFAVLPGCTIAAPFKPDILQITNSGYVTYQVNPNQDTTSVELGLGSDKGLYFAYTSAALTSQTIFGYILHPAVITSAAVATAKQPTAFQLLRGNVGKLTTVSAAISSVSGFALGNDGSLWFTALANGKPAIGKLPPAGAANWKPTLYTVPNASTILSLEPGIANTEALLYTVNNNFYVGTVNTDLSGFKAFRVSTGANPASVTPGDLLAGPFGSFYVSAGYTNASNVTTNNVYQISKTGALSTFCSNVNTVYRLSDGTGIGFRSFSSSAASAVVHVVPGQGCTQVPDPPQPAAPAGFSVFSGLYGVDSTAPDWIFYSNPNGHRGGIW